MEMVGMAWTEAELRRTAESNCGAADPAHMDTAFEQVARPG
jgi:hypothetical protein